jgi:hypothetical protein
MKRPIREDVKQQAMDAILTTTAKDSAWSCEACMHDMAIMMQSNLSKLSRIGIPTHTNMVQVVLLHSNLICLLAWKRKGIGELHKFKWRWETIFGNSQLLHVLFIMWDANYHVTIWCEMQTVAWMAYSDSTHFSNKNSFKILFILSYRYEFNKLLTFFEILQKQRTW